MTRSNTLTRISLAVAALLGASTAFAAGQDGYAASSNGRIITTDFGACVQTGSWKTGMEMPECDAALTAQLEAERLAAEEARRKAEFAAMQTSKTEPTLIRLSDQAKVAFALNSARLTAQGERELMQVVQAAGRYQQLESVQVTGHTDSTGSEAYNQNLSERRAESVKSFLAARGLDASRITVQGAGEMRPIADNRSREGRAQNRRVEILINGAASQQ